jgi:hypothetical protein
MVRLQMSEQFINRLQQISSPIAEHILGITLVDETSRNYINYLGVSNDDPTKISYVDKNKEKKNKIKRKRTYQYYPTEGKMQITKNFFKKRFWRGRWIENPNFVYSCVTGCIRKEKRSWYKRSFGFIHLMNSINDNPLKCVTYLEQYENGTRCSSSVTIGNAQFPSARWEYGWCNEKDKYDFNYNPDHLSYDSISLRREYFLENKHAVKISKSEVVREYDNLWKPQHRLHGSAGKIVKRIIGDSFDQLFTDHELETFCAAFRKQGTIDNGLDGKYRFKIVNGEELRAAYLWSNYFEASGTLGNSCMRYNETQKYLDMYVDNPNQVALGVLMIGDKVASRSLIWYPEGKEGSKVWYDRTYGHNSESEENLEMVLENLGYHNIYDRCNGNTYKIQLENGVDKYESWPYLDTLRYANNRVLSSQSGEETSVLDCADGGRSMNRCACCEHSAHELHTISDRRGVSYRGDELCDDCCAYSEYEDAYFHHDDLVYIEAEGSECLKDKCTYTDDGEYELDQHVITLHDGSTHTRDFEYITCIAGNCYDPEDVSEYCIFFNGDFYNHDHEDVVNVGDEYYHINDSRLVYLDSEEEYVLQSEEDTVFIQGEGMFRKSNPDIVCIDAEYYLKDSDEVVFIDYMNEYFLKSDSCIQEVDGVFLHEDDPLLEMLNSEDEEVTL